VGVRAEEVGVPFYGGINRIVNSVCRPGAVDVPGIAQGYSEFVAIGENAGDFFSARRRDRDLALGSARIEHEFLKLQALETRGDARQIAARRVALVASAGAIEVALARCCVAGLQISDGDAAPPA